VPSVPDGALDRTQAREFTSADVDVYNGFIYLRDRNTNVMTRFAVAEDLTVTDDGEFSFQATGLPTSRIYMAYLSPTLAYALDGAGQRLIGWNPTDMTLTGDEVSIDLERKGLPDVNLGVPTIVGDRVMVPVGWHDYANLIEDRAGVMILDPASPDDPIILDDQRVGSSYVVWTYGGVGYVGGTVGGDVKLFGTDLDGNEAPGSGIVRVNAGEDEFDDGYAVDTDEITGSIATWGIHLIDPTHVVAQILDPEIDPESFELPDDVVNSSDYIYVMIDTESGEWTEEDAIGRGGVGNSQEHLVDGVLYVQVTSEKAASVHGVTVEGGIGGEEFTVPSGDLWYMRRLR
jgi:hypothetical protein